jgi:nucleotide-binding universal stress UspA family protein
VAPTGERGTVRSPVAIAYDGSELAELAIDQAAAYLSTDQPVVVVTVWQPADVGFTPIDGEHFDANDARAVRAAAEATAAHGAGRIAALGFPADSLAIEAAPTWKGIIEAAAESGAGLIVIGSHRREGLIGHLVGNVASAVVAHGTVNVLLVHPRP